MGTEAFLKRLYRGHLKRVIDVFLAIAVLILSWPVLLLVYVSLRFSIGSPVIFQHIRPGFKGVPFKMYKFRTMTNDQGPNGHQLPDEKRVTKIGRVLRSLSLDELPETFNVLKGDMSFVGPRPLLMEYMERYSPEQSRRHDVKPGITGWAQVNGRNAITWERKFAMDIWYVDNQSFMLDVRILARTFVKVLRRDGISEEGYATASYFTGNDTKVRTKGQ